MTERFDAIAFREGQNGKPYAVRLGSAVPKKNGPGYTLYLDAIPAPKDGQYVITIAPPREQGQRPSVNGSPRREVARDMDDFQRRVGGSGSDPDDFPF